MDKSTYKIGSLIRYKTFLPSEQAPMTSMNEKSFKDSLVKVFESKQGVDPNSIHRFVGTSEAVDRDGEVILAKAWDFTNYEKNPVVLWSHDRKALPIGKTVGIYTDEATKMTYFDIALSEGYPFSKDVKTLVEEGIIRATSVGFRVNDWMWE
jgi:HK97 family phage prohead protease